MIEKNIVLKNETGFHARPASVFVKCATGFKSEVFLIKDNAEHNGKSIMGLLSMGAGMGTELVLRVEGEDEEQAVEQLLKVLDEMQ